MNLHARSGDIASVDDIAPDQDQVSGLFFFHMLEQGFYVARRGFIVVSLPLTDDDLERFADALSGFLAKYAALLRD